MRLVRITAAIIISLILVASCSSAETDELVPEYDPRSGGSEIDLLGYDYTFAAMAHGSDIRYSLNPESGNSSRGDKLLQRYRDTENKYNVKISLINGCDLGRFMTLYAANLKYADMMLTTVNSVFGGRYIQNGYFVPFSDLDIDLSSGLYGSPSCIETGNFLGDYYSVIAYYWGFPSADTTPTMWYNPRVISNYRQTDPHELDEQGEWTWSTLEMLCEAIHDTSDPDPDKYVYAMAYTSEPYLEMAALYSNSARVVTQDADGRMVYSLNSNEAVEAMSFLNSLRERDLICDGGDRFNITPFVENRRAFFFEYTHMGLSDEGADNLSFRMQEAYEWIYFPEGPSHKQGDARTAYSYWSRFFYTPINSDAEVTEILLPYLFQPLPGDTVDTWQDEFERTTFFTHESFEYFQRLRDDAFCDNLAFIYSAYSTFQSALMRMTKGDASITETLESLGDKIQASLDSYHNDYMD